MGKAKRKVKPRVTWPLFSWVGDVVSHHDGLKYFNSLHIDYSKTSGTDIHVGDHIFMESESSEPYIAMVQSLYEDAKNEKWVQCKWYYRQGDVPKSYMSRLSALREDDIFMSKFSDANVVESIIGLCNVKIFVNGEGVNVRKEKNTFICRYLYDMGRFTKLKNSDVFPTEKHVADRATVSSVAGVQGSSSIDSCNRLTEEGCDGLESYGPTRDSTWFTIPMTMQEAIKHLRDGSDAVSEETCWGILGMCGHLQKLDGNKLPAEVKCRRSFLEYVVGCYRSLEENEKTRYADIAKRTSFECPWKCNNRVKGTDSPTAGCNGIASRGGYMMRSRKNRVSHSSGIKRPRQQDKRCLDDQFPSKKKHNISDSQDLDALCGGKEGASFLRVARGALFELLNTASLSFNQIEYVEESFRKSSILCHPCHSVNGSFVMIPCDVTERLLLYLRASGGDEVAAVRRIRMMGGEEIVHSFSYEEQIHISKVYMQHGLSEEKIRGCVPPSRGDAAVEYARRFLRPPSSPLLSEGSSESSNGAKDSVMQEVVEFLTGARELLEDWAFAQLLNTLLLYHKHVISTDELV